MRTLREYTPRLLLILVLTLMGAALCTWLYPLESTAVAKHLVGFPDSDVPSANARPLILAALCFIPALAALCYAMGDTLDRYVTRQFAVIFGLCIFALFVIWLLIDLGDNFSDFRGSQNLFLTMAKFYATRLPAILILLLPYSLLLSLLYSLGKLSTSREIIAVIQSGRGVVRTTRPLIVAGALCTMFCIGLNYHWGPVAEGMRDNVVAEGAGKSATEASKVLYLNQENRRLWMIGEFPANYEYGMPLTGVEVTTTNPDKSIHSRLTASRAVWNRQTREWTFENPVVGRFQQGAPPDFVQLDKPLVLASWSETPWQLIKPGLSARYLGIPDLTTWLRANDRTHGFADPAPYLTHWQYRWAQPFTCIVTVLLAAPLAIHFARRGAGGEMFLAVVLSAVMLFFNTISLALGEAGLLRPTVAAWLPNLVFSLLGLYLFHRRIAGLQIYQSMRRLLPGSD